jgi:transcriptional regulator with XRE-family HTH domain
MIYLKENLRYLRKQKEMTQGDLAEKLDIKRSQIGSYEEGRGVPKLSVIRQMAINAKKRFSWIISNKDILLGYKF